MTKGLSTPARPASSRPRSASGARRRLLLSAAGAAIAPALARASGNGATATANGARTGDENRGAPLRALPLAEPVAQIHSDGAWLWAMTRTGTLMRHDGARWEGIVQRMSPVTPIASGYGTIAARTTDGALWTFRDGERRRSRQVRLMPHAGMLVTPSAVVAVARAESGDAQLVRLEAGATHWDVVAESPQPVLPDARPVAADLDGSGATGDDRGITVLAGPDAARYQHAVLGDSVEAGSILYLESRTLRVMRSLVVPAPNVIEDVTLRPVVWRGRSSVLTVRSGPRGAQLIAVSISTSNEKALDIVAVGPPLGQPNRWLAPTTDGRLLLAVHTPHIGGVLHAYEGDPGDPVTLRVRMVLPGVSNHALGSRDVDLSGWLGHRLVLPTQDRRQLLVLDAEREFVPVGRFDLAAPLVDTRVHRDGMAVLDAEGRVGWVQIP